MNQQLLMDKFFTNVEELNSKFGIYPLLYGSLGLQQYINQNLNPSDIDILIPQIFLREKWNNFKLYLESEGYELIDLHEHTFIKDNVLFSYASIENLYEFAEIKLDEIKLVSMKEKVYLVLTLNQYLKVYKKSCLDGYRVAKKEKKDYEKICLIEEAMK